MKIQNISSIKSAFQHVAFEKRKSISDYAQMHKNIGLSRATLPYIITRKAENENEYFEQFINAKGKVSLSDYQTIVKKHPRTLTKSYALCERQAEVRTRHHKMARFEVCLKDYYDKKYEKYTIVSIGTSPSPITEVMSNLGCEVIYLPISHLRFIEQNPLSPFRKMYPTNESRHPNIKTLMKYASKKGIADPKKC